MEKLKTEDFLKWVEKSRWLKINEVGTHDGYQENYVTPAGEFVIAQYNLNKELVQLAKPMPPPPQGMPMKGLPMDFLHGGKFPGGPAG